MIASLHGKILDIFSDSLAIEIGGIGLQVFTSPAVRQAVRPGESIFLHTCLIVRQDALTLYGFETREEREFFNLLLGVDGIGPKSALGVLSALSPDAIRRAVFQEQAEVFSRAPGVGKKTAQKILLHLQDRLPAVSGFEQLGAASDVDTEVIAALTALGYSVVEAQAAMQSLGRNAPEDVEERLRLALQYFS
jgi:Holliday junction DNA helicase RuvA